MEKIFALILLLLLTGSIVYLFIGFVVIPLIKIYRENLRLKREN